MFEGGNRIVIVVVSLNYCELCFLGVASMHMRLNEEQKLSPERAGRHALVWLHEARRGLPRAPEWLPGGLLPLRPNVRSRRKFPQLGTAVIAPSWPLFVTHLRFIGTLFTFCLLFMWVPSGTN